MRALIRKLSKYLAYAAAAAVMLLALLVGVARLLLPLVPDYQEDIRAWASQATGFEVQFEFISASWPIAGPEIRFLDVTIQSPDDLQPIFVADSLNIGVSVVRLLRDRQVTVSRVGIENTNVVLLQTEEREFLVQGRPLADFLPERDPDDPLEVPDIDIQLRDVGIAYRNLGRDDPMMEFRVDSFDLRLRGDAACSLDGDIQLPVRFGERATVSLDLPIDVLRGGLTGPADDAVIAPVEWSVYVGGEALKMAGLLEYGLDMPTPVADMDGNLVVWAEFEGREPTGVTAELDFSDAEFRTDAANSDRYEAISGRVEWARVGGGWVLAGSDMNLRRVGLFAPRTEFSVTSKSAGGGAGRQLLASVDFMRLDDWYPLVRAFVSEDLRRDMLPASVSGDISDFRLDALLISDEEREFDVEVRFEDIGVVGLPAGEGLTGVTGTVVADEAGGRLQLDSEQAALTIPKLFAVPLAADALEGFLVWRATPDGVRVLSDNISVRIPIGEASSRFELTLPSNGESPFLDLTATAQVNSAPGVLDYLPLNRFTDKLSGWLRRSILAGRITGADIAIRGPLRRFPFAGGDGVFRVVVDVADGKLDYAPEWPEVENLTAQLVFDGVSFATRSNSANYGGLFLQNADVRIPNLRKGMLSVTGPQTATFDQVLGFLRASPLADAVGPILDRVGGAGNLSADVEFLLPIKRPKEYDLRLDIDTEDAQLSLQRVDFDLTRITGSLTVRNTKFYADDLTAELLGEPVTVSLRPAEAGGSYAQFITMRGITPVRSWIDVLNLPQADRFDGAPAWQALTMIPARREGEGEDKTPLKIVVRSDLVGVESRLPAPLAKTADVTRALELGIAWPDEESLEITGRLAGDLNWALQLEAVDGRLRVERGNVHAGTAAALLPLEPGVALTGHVGFIRLDDWLALADGGADPNWQELYRSAELRADRLAIFGQQFPGVSLDARRAGRTWKIAVDGPNLAGDITLPPDSNNDDPIVLDLERMWLVESDPGDRTDGDPREVPPVSISADEFVLGKLRFGSLTASMRSTPYGLEVEPINIVGPTFTIEGNAAWLVSPNDDSVQQSRMRLALRGTDIEAVLASFGYQPVIEGESVAANADLSWTGAPNAEFLYRADGRFSVDMQKGALLSLEPGGGRLLGILSVTALPRRLALDFRDVTDEGLRFDTLRGDFTLDTGNVYTCNLGLEGSVADMGIVGRTGLRDEDYDQLAVVRPHVSTFAGARRRGRRRTRGRRCDVAVLAGISQTAQPAR